MADILFINEEFFKQNVSQKQSYDKEQVISSIRLIQKTNLISIISLPVYENFQAKLASGDAFTSGEQKLFDTMQLFLAVKVAEEMIFSAPRREADHKDDAHISYGNKSILMEARMVRDINRDTELLALAQSGEEDFSTEVMDVRGGFYFG